MKCDTPGCDATETVRGYAVSIQALGDGKQAPDMTAVILSLCLPCRNHLRHELLKAAVLTEARNAGVPNRGLRTVRDVSR